MKAGYAPRALRDLERIAAHLGGHNPVAMQRILAAIQESINTPEQLPELGRPVRGAQRRLPVPRTSYLIYYRILGEEMPILHIRDGRRKPYSV